MIFEIIKFVIMIFTVVGAVKCIKSLSDWILNKIE